MKDLSLVIIGKNAESSIARLLDSLVAYVPSQLATEIIYVDSASSDRTVEIVSQYRTTVIRLSTDQPLCASAGRYVGSKYSDAKYICFLDSDMELLEGWLERALNIMKENPKVAVITGRVQDCDAAIAKDDLSPIDYALCQNATLVEITFAGGASLYRRSVLMQVGNWNPYIISDEEPELCLRIRHAGYRVVRLDYPLARHYTAPNSSIVTILARRKRRLYLGQGQAIRYYIGTKLLMPYLRERAHGVTTAGVMLLAMGAIYAWWATVNKLWLWGCVVSLGITLVADAIRTRSLYLPLLHVVHRAVLLEGTIRGFLMHPHQSEEYVGNVTVEKHSDEIRGVADMFC